MAPPEITLTIVRGDQRPLLFAAKSMVTGAPLDLAGSDFFLKLKDALGGEELNVKGSIDNGRIRIDLTLEQRAALPAGRNGRWSLHRVLDGGIELWAHGPTHITGAA